MMIRFQIELAKDEPLQHDSSKASEDSVCLFFQSLVKL